LLEKDKSAGVNALRRMLQQQHGWTVSENGIKKVRWCNINPCSVVCFYMSCPSVAPTLCESQAPLMQVLKVLRPVAGGGTGNKAVGCSSSAAAAASP